MKSSYAAAAGTFVWCTGLLIVLPAPFDAPWARAMLLFAPLVLVPMALSLIDTEGLLWRIVKVVQLPAALLLALGFVIPPGALAAGLSLGWLATTLLIGVAGLHQLCRQRFGSVEGICIAAGLMYLPVGSFWAVFDRFGARPLDFEPIIVLLTAIHFHYVGFLLPILTGLALHQVGQIANLPRQISNLRHVGAIGVVLSMPLVAAGITATQLKLGTITESVAAVLMAAAGASTAVLYLRLAACPTFPRGARVLWLFGGLCLLFGMLLATLYGMRFYLPLAWLDVPWMRALHGTANAFGFTLAALLGWLFAATRRSERL